jgi:hypothetical protein
VHQYDGFCIASQALRHGSLSKCSHFAASRATAALVRFLLNKLTGSPRSPLHSPGLCLPRAEGFPTRRLTREAGFSLLHRRTGLVRFGGGGPECSGYRSRHSFKFRAASVAVIEPSAKTACALPALRFTVGVQPTEPSVR